MSGPRHQELAEAVRAYLVGLRGGAPFLSSADARLLKRWLDQDLPLWLILEGLDKAAAKRRERRLRTPLSLQHAKAFVKVESDLVPRVSGLSSLIRDLSTHADPQVRELSTELADAPSCEAAVARITQWHESRWEQADRALWLEKAADELEDLKELVSEERFKSLCAETARDLMRQQVPALCASRVWDTVEG